MQAEQVPIAAGDTAPAQPPSPIAGEHTTIEKLAEVVALLVESQNILHQRNIELERQLRQCQVKLGIYSRPITAAFNVERANHAGAQ